MNLKKWPIGAIFKYKSPYSDQKFDRFILKVGLNSVSDTFTYEWYLKNKDNGSVSIVSTKGIIYKIYQIEIESPGEHLRKEREKKLKKIINA